MPLDPVVFKAVADYGITVVGIVAVSAAAWWILKNWTNDLREGRNRAFDISERQVAATENLTSAVKDQTGLVKQLLDVVEETADHDRERDRLVAELNTLVRDRLPSTRR